MSAPRDVFVSYSNPDRDCAFAIVTALEARNIGVWVAPRDVSPAADWAAEIVEAIARARMMVLVFSAHSNESPQVRREVERAVHRQVPVLPFRIAEILPARSLEYFLSSQHWLDAFAGPLAPYVERLADHCQRVLAPAVVPDVAGLAPRISEYTGLTPGSGPCAALEGELAQHVGPIARVLLARALPVALGWEDLVRRLGSEIESASARLAFTDACARIAH